MFYCASTLHLNACAFGDVQEFFIQTTPRERHRWKRKVLLHSTFTVCKPNGVQRYGSERADIDSELPQIDECFSAQELTADLVTCAPPRASRIAAALPARAPPITRTSVVI